MSSRLERWRESWEDDSIADLVVAWYQVPALLLLMGFMLWTRLRSYDNFVRDGEVFFSGNDAYYHLREVTYAVEHWPWTMPFDPWTRFPFGASADQFGTLYDQIVATVALIVGLGDPSEQTIALTLLVAPAVFGALVALPTYFLGKRIGGRLGGVLAVFLLALLPGAFFQRSLAGFSDHHVAEVLFQATAVLATMLAVAVAERERPVYEQFKDADLAGLRRPLAWGGLAGLSIGLYLWTWPPAVILVGILGVFYALAMSIETARGKSPEHLAIVGITSMLAAGVMALARIDTLDSTSVTTLSLLQVTLIVSVAIGCAFLAALARAWESRGLDSRLYPVGVGTLVVAGALVASVVLPDLFDTVVNNMERSFGFGQSDTALTVREAQSVPFGSLGTFMLDEYGLLFVTGLIGLVLLGWDCYRSDRYRSESLLVVVWAIFTTLMALTQVRFNYYLAVVVAILNVRFFVALGSYLDLPDGFERLSDVKGYQVMTILAVAILVVVPLAPPVSASNVVSSGQNIGPGASVVTWNEGLDWMSQNTPEEGTYGGGGDPMPYYGTYERTDDFDYPEGAYGVMSWWDYGHWITVQGERIPVANPFQSGARDASAYFQASNETRATLMLEVLPSMGTIPGRLDDLTQEELESIVADQSSQRAQEDTRYVMIDSQMAGGKFRAIATWAGPASGRDGSFQEVYYSRQEVSVFDGSAQLVGMSQRYRETMLARLYFRDASGLSHYRLVHESDQQSTFVSVAQQTASGPRTALVHRELSGPLFRAVQQRPDLEFYNVQRAASVKTYERVEGATLTGTVPQAQNATPVVAFVQLQTDTGRNFTYVQQTLSGPDGSFAMTVPYSTDDAVGTAAGGTNSSVLALGEYTVQSGTALQASASGSAAVPEEAIYEGREIQVELEPVEQGNQSTDGENQTSDDGGQEPESGSQPPGSGNESSNTDNETAGSLAVERRTASAGP